VGTFTRNNDKKQGKIILYPSKFSHQNITAQQSPSPHWVKSFINDIKLNKKSPHLREKERGDFAFKPIYFDYDKFEIKEEYFSFLKSMIEVISEHSDLRIKITGHTDPDGSDAYNNELSKKRANAIQDFFVKNGLNADKLVIDFKGEKELINPTDQSENGKQLNRRVDFVFI
jgi:outer membrane protein OmpA-like peptidoglycan-associated protein